MTALAPTLQAFFTDRLTRQRNASPHTIAGYRDTWRMLLTFAAARTGTAPSMLDLDDLDAPLVAAFLDHLENDRGNSVRTRNTRLAAIHSLFRYAALTHPEHAHSISRVLAIPPKRFDRALICYLTEPEVEALLASLRPDNLDRTTRPRDAAARRADRATDLRTDRPHPSRSAPGRRRPRRLSRQGPQGTGNPADHRHPRRAARLAQRAHRRPHRAAVPQPPRTAPEPRRHRTPDQPLRRPGHPGMPVAARRRPITAHVLRHTTAMRLLHAGVDTSVIALWLGHVSIETTQIYLHADMTLKDERSPEPARRTAGTADTSPPTPCSPGSKRSDYADLASAEPQPCKGISDHIGIIRRSA